MNLINLIYAVSFGFGVSFLVLQFFLSVDDDHTSNNTHEINNHGNELTHNSEDFDSDNSHHHSGSEIHTDDISNHAEHSSISSTFMSFLTFLRFTRKITYFCAGFGTIGIFCIFTKVPTLLGLVYSITTGLLSTLLSTLIFKFINPSKNEQNYRIKSENLVGCYGEVITKAGPNENDIGEIKISLDKNIVNLYAIPNKSGTEFKKGDIITVYKINNQGYALIETSNADELNVSIRQELNNEERKI